MTTTASPALELYDVAFADALGPRETSVLATDHDDAADQIAALYAAGVNVTTRRRDGDYLDHAAEATLRLAQRLAGTGGSVIDLGDTWLIEPAGRACTEAAA